jgi:hypothetical protein
MATSNGSFSLSPNGNGYFPKGAAPSTRPNYATWTWKEIEASIRGGSELTGNGESIAAGYASPPTMWDTGNALEYVRQTLIMVAQSVSDQAKALAGGNDPPWKGEAASTFLNYMTLFSQQVSANAEVLDGGSGAMNGTVPQQLVEDGNALSEAQATVIAIDEWYAQQAIKMGAPVMSNGLVQVSAIKGLPEIITQEMYTNGLMPLVGHYEVTKASIISPTLTPAPGPGGGGGGGGGAGGGNHSPGPLPKPGPLPGPSPFPGPGQSPPGQNVKLTDPTFSPGPGPGLSHIPGLGPAALGVGPNSLPPGPGGVVPFPGGATSSPGGLGPGGPSLPAPLLTKDAVSPGGSGPGLGPGLGSGLGAGGGAAGDALTDPLLPGLAVSPFDDSGLSGLGDGLGAPGDVPLGDLSPLPGMGAGLGTGAGAGAAGDALTDPLLPGLAVSPFDDSGLSGLGDGLGVPGGEPLGELPLLPGMGGAGMGGTGGPERSDASGLLGGTDEPWLQRDLEEEMAPGAVAGGAGLSGLGDGLGVPGGEPLGELPLLPGMGGAGMGGTGGPERSDASGLLGGTDEPWLEAGLAEFIATGAAPGGAGLTGLEQHAETPEDIAAWDTGVAGAMALLRGTAGGAGPDDPGDDEGLARWRPLPAAPGDAPGATPDELPAAALELGLRSSGADYTEPPDDAEEKEEDESAAPTEEADMGGAAGLLVEDASLWGTWQSDPGALG